MLGIARFISIHGGQQVASAGNESMKKCDCRGYVYAVWSQKIMLGQECGVELS
jgi:hypothetical protein